MYASSEPGTQALLIEKGVAGWPPLSGLLRVLVVVVARRRRRPPQLEALPAIDRLVRARLEGDLGISATFRADRRKHLARSAGVTPTATGRITATARGVRSAAAVSAGGVASAATTTTAAVARVVSLRGALRLAG